MWGKWLCFCLDNRLPDYGFSNNRKPLRSARWLSAFLASDMSDEGGHHELIELFRRVWKPAVAGSTCVSASTALRAWLDWSQARAVGWWHRHDDVLRMIGFEASIDMPIDVQVAFADAMREVSLDRIELGCVRAAAEMRPVVAREDAANWGLGGSATWLQRFAAQQSLAIPIVQDSTVVGVLAIATAEPFEESSATWKMLAELVTELGGNASRGSDSPT